MKELKKENAKLNQKVKELTQENETLSTNENELNSLQKLLKMDKGLFSVQGRVLERVISKEAATGITLFVINNKVPKDGIKVNMNVTSRWRVWYRNCNGDRSYLC
ncbi:MAG: hypothetical protein ACLRYY_03805 [Anaerobutyricum soehngenii]